MTWGKLSVTGVGRGRTDHKLHLRNCLYLFVHPTSAGPSGTQAPKGVGVGTVFSVGSLGPEPKGRERPGTCQYPPNKVAFLARNSLQE